jgi:hypothetical protein
MSERSKDAVELARTFLALNAQEFRLFWSTVLHEWNDEDSDIEAMWFYFGQQVTAREVAVIGALHSAVHSGQKSRKG